LPPLLQIYMRKKKILNNLYITGIADKGKAVGRTTEGEVVFVEGAVPGDTVDVTVLKKRKSYSDAVVNQFVEYSKERSAPFCKHFWECGGCKWQHMAYPSQLKYKKQSVMDAMQRIAKIDSSIISDVKGAPKSKYYRNKLEFSFSVRRWLTREEIDNMDDIPNRPGLGFHRAGSFDRILDIDECFLMEPLANDLRNFIREYTYENNCTYYNFHEHTGLMRNIIVRNSTIGQWMVIIIFGEKDIEKILPLMESVKNRFPQITSLNYVINLKKNDTIYDQEVINYYGTPFITEKLGEINYKIGLKSFFQTNSHQAKVLFDTVMDFAEFKGNEIVYDLYTGLGSIALYMADKVKHVTGIEEVAAAIEDAHENAALNDINNVDFYTGDVKDILNEEFVTKHGKADVIVTDPPRAGMHDDVLRTLLQFEAPKIVYVSCNPGTQARDLAILSEKYEVVRMQPVDMFPQTHHIENVALLSLKNK
jgi:23S rRNA (uracil1939-C5)-methyltransferase